LPPTPHNPLDIIIIIIIIKTAMATRNPDETPNQTPDGCPCGSIPPCPREYWSLHSDYLRGHGCGIVTIRSCLPPVSSSDVTPWTEFRADVLQSIFGDLMARTVPHPSNTTTPRPTTTDTTTDTTPDAVPINSEDDFHHVFTTYTLPVLKSAIREAGSVLRPDLPVVTIEAAPRDANTSRNWREPVPDFCVIGASPASGPESMVVFVAGNVVMPHAFSSTTLAAIIAAADSNRDDDDDKVMRGGVDWRKEEEEGPALDAIRHVAAMAIASKARYGFLANPDEVIVMRFSRGGDDDDDDEEEEEDDDDDDDDDIVRRKSVHVEWASAPWGSPSEKNGLAFNTALAFLGFLGLVDQGDTDGLASKAEMKPLNGWKPRAEGGYVSVVNPSQTVQEVPACGVLLEE
jgi:hypothetical protein